MAWGMGSSDRAIARNGQDRPYCDLQLLGAHVGFGQLRSVE
ncbi:hypothetical protein [Synechococcus elongatus]